MSTTRRSPCPQCDRGPKDTALAVTTDARGTVSFCHRCGFTEANNATARSTLPPIVPAKAAKQRWSNLAELLWRRSQPLRGSIAERYLLGRHCVLPPEDGDLRFLPVSGKFPAAMLARVTDAVTGEPMTLHFTHLSSSAEKLDRILQPGHQKKGGVIRLWPDEAVTQGLAIAEGIETALSAAHIYMPVWSTIDAGNMAALPALTGVSALTIFADHDKAGVAAAKACAATWRGAGKDVQIYVPEIAGADLNDVVREVAA